MKHFNTVLVVFYLFILTVVIPYVRIVKDIIIFFNPFGNEKNKPDCPCMHDNKLGFPFYKTKGPGKKIK